MFFGGDGGMPLAAAAAAAAPTRGPLGRSATSEAAQLTLQQQMQERSQQHHASREWQVLRSERPRPASHFAAVDCGAGSSRGTLPVPTLYAVGVDAVVGLQAAPLAAAGRLGLAAAPNGVGAMRGAQLVAGGTPYLMELQPGAAERAIVVQRVTAALNRAHAVDPSGPSVQIVSVQKINNPALDLRYANAARVHGDGPFPDLVYHGTKRECANSIAALGFLVGGVNVERQHGNFQGNGVYHSQDPDKALTFTQGDVGTLIVSTVRATRSVLGGTLIMSVVFIFNHVYGANGTTCR